MSSILDKLENFKLIIEKDSEIAYLGNKEMMTTLNSALVQLYRVKPENPVGYLAHYLLNEARSYAIKQEIELERKSKEEYQEKLKKKQLETKIQQAKQKEEDDIKALKKKKLIDFIGNSQNMDDDLNPICNELKSIVNATGVYFSLYDFKHRFVSKEEDENAHLDKNNKVIRYIAFDDSSSFLKHKCLENSNAITYGFFVEAKDQGDAGLPQDGGVDDKPVESEENKIQTIYEEEVIRNPNIYYFLEPKLGCYFALNLSYKSSQSLKSLDSSIQKWAEFLQEQVEIDQRKIQRENEKKEQEHLNNQNQDAGMDGVDDQQPEIEEVAVLKDYEISMRDLILSLDTLGQDRGFTEEEQQFIKEIGKHISNRYYNLEKNLLLKDRDIRIAIKEKETAYCAENKEDKIKEAEDRYYKEYLARKYEDK